MIDSGIGCLFGVGATISWFLNACVVAHSGYLNCLSSQIPLAGGLLSQTGIIVFLIMADDTFSPLCLWDVIWIQCIPGMDTKAATTRASPPRLRFHGEEVEEAPATAATAEARRMQTKARVITVARTGRSRSVRRVVASCRGGRLRILLAECCPGGMADRPGARAGRRRWVVAWKAKGSGWMAPLLQSAPKHTPHHRTPVIGSYFFHNVGINRSIKASLISAWGQNRSRAARPISCVSCDTASRKPLEVRELLCCCWSATVWNTTRLQQLDSLSSPPAVASASI